MIIELSKENLKKIEKISKIDKLALDCIKHDINTILSTYQFEFNTPKTRDSMNAQISEYLANHIINIREERLNIMNEFDKIYEIIKDKKVGFRQETTIEDKKYLIFIRPDVENGGTEVVFRQLLKE